MAFIDAESAKNIFSRQDFMNQLKKRFWSGCNFANQRKKNLRGFIVANKTAISKIYENFTPQKLLLEE